MGQTWFYFGGWLPESITSTLKVENERIFGKRGRRYCEILPADIVNVEEFSFNNAFLLVTTREGRFHVGVHNRRYDEVVRILEKYVGSEFCDTLVHRSNVLFARKQFSVWSIVKSFFTRRR